jgi:hypothetical protein
VSLEAACTRGRVFGRAAAPTPPGADDDAAAGDLVARLELPDSMVERLGLICWRKKIAPSEFILSAIVSAIARERSF